MAASFATLQRRFAAHLRDPRRNKVPAGLEARRMKIYADLFYNNIEGFLAKAFPVIRRLTPDGRWHLLVREFFSSHRCRTPLFHQVAGEFLGWLQRRAPRRGEPGFLRELAHYEWIELDLATAALDLADVAANARGDLLAGRPMVSPLLRKLRYAWPVHRIGPDFMPRRPPPAPTHLLVFRDRRDDVHFLEANAATAGLVEDLQSGRRTGAQALQRLARRLHGKSWGSPHDAVMAEGARMLGELARRDILLGTVPETRRR